jgi:hypothetical protein
LCGDCFAMVHKKASKQSHVADDVATHLAESAGSSTTTATPSDPSGVAMIIAAATALREPALSIPNCPLHRGKASAHHHIPVLIRFNPALKCAVVRSWMVAFALSSASFLCWSHLGRTARARRCERGSCVRSSV